MFVDLRHQVPGRPGVESIAVPLDRTDTTAERGILLEEVDGVSFACQQGCGGEARRTSTDDTDALCHGRPSLAVDRMARDARRIFTTLGMRTRS